MRKRYKKLILLCCAILVVSGAAYIGYYLVRYRFYDVYKESLKEYIYEDGTEFKAMSDSDPKVEGMVLVAENESLKLYFNTTSCEVAVYDKGTNKVTYSNPQQADEDPVANETNKNLLKSQLVVEYYSSKRLAGTYNSYEYSVSSEQFSFESLENGIRVIYELGKNESKTGIVPLQISEVRLQEVLNKLEDPKEQRYIKIRYKKSSKDGILELNEGAREGKATLANLNKYFEKTGYTMEDYVRDSEETGVETELPLMFTVPLEYRLTDDGLNVSIPTGHIEESGGGSIYRIQVLRNFGAAGTDQDGYMLVPNGSGSTINFNNGKVNADDYMEFVYDMDPMAQEYSVLGKTESMRLPVYGMQYKDYGMFVTIKEGESLAAISATISGKLNSYNCAYPSFTLRTIEKLAMFGQTGNESELPTLEKQLYDCNITINYSFLSKDYDGYAGMARFYRERLEKEGVLVKKEESSDISFYMDVIGAISKEEYALGIPYYGIEAMTTYEDASKMIDSLSNDGVKNVVMNYKGWFNDGYYHDVVDRLKPVKKLGSEKELEALSKKLEDAGGKFYGDVAFQKVSFLSDHFDYMRESSRYYASGYIAAFGQTNPTSYRQTSSLGYMETLYDVLSPKFLPRYVNTFSDRIEEYDITGISLRDLGNYLASDKKRTESIDREQAKNIVIDQFKTLEDTKKQLMVSGGNLYSLQFADDIIDMPLQCNDYFIVDREVPFYQMVVHGYISYAGSSINLNNDFLAEDVILQLIEFGAAPRYTFTQKSSNELKYTGLNMFYSTAFDTWNKDAAKIYNEVNNALKHVSNATMDGYEVLEPGVKKVTYSNGIVIYINQSQNAYEVDGSVLEAKSYKVEGVN